MRRMLLSLVALLGPGVLAAPAQDVRIVRPTAIDDVLVNPGIGFMTFQRFNGDALNEGAGWTEGLPIVYQEWDGDLTNVDHPDTSLAYFRVNWRFVETAPHQYAWDMIDRALATARSRGQTLLLRISPYEEDVDVPDWYRAKVGPEPELSKKWRTDPENPLYLEFFGGLIRRLGDRYDGHPDLESVDVSIVGYWGEGSGGHMLTEHTRKALLRAYLDSFHRTRLLFQPLNGDAPDPGFLVEGLPIAASWPDGRTNGTGPQMRHLGLRFDCLGDLGFWKNRVHDWAHMFDVYPEQLIQSGMADAWRKAPVSLEICGTFRSWRDRQGYGEKEVRYIFDQALKWHISSFNAKSSPVPPEWMPLVDDWLKRMGYRLVLRKLTYPTRVQPNGVLPFQTWWENRGVAPCYEDFALAVRLVGEGRSIVRLTDAHVPSWLPGDSLYDGRVFLPLDAPEGTYELQIGLVDRQTREPRVRLAIEGRTADGWYSMGPIKVEKGSYPVTVERDLDTP
jgi:Domain of unknown function (DUF4832)